VTYNRARVGWKKAVQHIMGREETEWTRGETETLSNDNFLPNKLSSKMQKNLFNFETLSKLNVSNSPLLKIQSLVVNSFNLSYAGRKVASCQPWKKRTRPRKDGRRGILAQSYSACLASAKPWARNTTVPRKYTLLSFIECELYYSKVIITVVFKMYAELNHIKNLKE
jgi:hypothetical protein